MITPTPIQQSAVDMILKEPFSILTGGPGTGKSSVLELAHVAAKERRETVALAAPTGKAARRMTEIIGTQASTLHRLLRLTPESKPNERRLLEEDDYGPDGQRRGGVGSDGKITADRVFVDEASMLDVYLAAALFNAVDLNRTKITLIGDDYQLPSVGPGRVLADLLQSGAVPFVQLTEVHRAAQESWICKWAPTIRAGGMPDLSSVKDFAFWNCKGEDIEEAVIQAAYGLKQRGLRPAIITPRRGKVFASAEFLNPKLQDLFNSKTGPEGYIPPSGVMTGVEVGARAGDDRLRVGDYVMQRKNDYAAGVYNGECGIFLGLSEVKEEGSEARRLCTIAFEGHDEPKSVALNDLNVRLAYAITVHCVSPDTLVETPNGLWRMDELLVKGKIGTPDGWRDYRNLVWNPPSRMLRIRTKDGYTLDVTPEHGMSAWSGSAYFRKSARDLRVGDGLRLRIGSECDTKKSPSLPVLPRLDTRTQPIRLPKFMSGELAEFMGLVVGDGTVFRSGVRLVKRHTDVVERFAVLGERLFGLKAHRFAQKNKEAAEFSSVALAQWLLRIGGMAPKNKAVPSVVLRSPLKMQAAFLRGLFEDGTVNLRGKHVDHVEWSSSASEEMVRQVQVMLLRLGIVSSWRKRTRRLSERHRPSFLLYVYGAYVAEFKKRVNFIAEFKRARLRDFAISGGSKYNVPVSEKRARELSTQKSLRGNVVTRGGISMAKAREVGGFEEELRFHHDPIASIEEIDGASMCVEVPGYHRFLQNGFDGWNSSQGSQWPWVVVVCHSGHGRILTRQLLYTAVTRAQKGLIIIGDTEGIEVCLRNNEPLGRQTALPSLLGER